MTTPGSVALEVVTLVAGEVVASTGGVVSVVDAVAAAVPQVP